MRAKLLIILLGLVGLFSAAIVFRVDQLLSADKLTTSEAQARAQVGAVSETVATELKAARETMQLAWPQIQAEKKDYGAGQLYSRFAMLASATRAAGGEWTLDNKYFLENSPVKSWASNYATLAMKSVRESKVPVGSTAVLSLLDPARKVFFLIVAHTAANPQWLVALSGPELFQGAMDRQKGLVSTFYVVNPLGQTLGHTTPEYVGSLMSEDPVVSDLIKNESGSGFGVFPSANGSVQGFYEQVPQSNVFVVISTPMSELMAARKGVRWQLILMGLGFALVGTALVLSFVRETPAAAKVAAPGPAPAAAGPVEARAVPEDADRLQIYTRAASGLAHELRGPLLSLLGRARLLRESTPDPEVQKELIKLEEGAREAHGTLHKLLTFAGEKDEPVVPTSVSEAVTRTLRMMETKFQAAGIEVESDLAEVPLIQGQPTLLTKAFEQIFENAVEAMQRGLTKKIKIELRPADENRAVVLKISDTGIGIEPAHIEQIFDPFFTTKSSGAHSGLGLSLALGIVKACGGRMQARSISGQGTEFEIRFPVPEPPAAEAEEEVRFVRRVRPVPAEASENSPLPAPGSEPSAASAEAASLESEPTVVGPPPPPPPVTRMGGVKEPASAPAVEVPEVLNDRLMEKTLNMIDQLDDVPAPPGAPEMQAPPAPPPVRKPEPSEADGPAPVEPAVAAEPPPFRSGADSKIDKPKGIPKRKESRLLDAETQVRRPGDRS